MQEEPERSGSGQPIYRHKAPAEPAPIVHEATPFLEQIGEHIERWIGPVPMVFHEIVSPTAHIDLHIVPPAGREPTADHPFAGDHYTVVTSGMSSRPMSVPEGAEELRYAELMIALPKDWPGLKPDGTFDREVMKDEANWWPFRWLKQLARLPHEYDTFLTVGHTVPNGDPAEPFAANTKQCCMLVGPAVLVPEEARRLVVGDGIAIHFYALWPLYKEEMDLKLDRGLEALTERLGSSGVTEMIDPKRKNCCKKFLGLF